MTSNKNLHILPTDKPSRLIKLSNGKLRYNKDSGLYSFLPQNIYITSDEEIKKGDWVFNPVYKTVYQWIKNADIHFDRIDAKKIILTTDQDLIKDGVQAIPDEFLEWFVKNPSCESVEIDIQRIFGRSSPLDTLGQTFITYKITNYEN
jgi:hypothetical protein